MPALQSILIYPLAFVVVLSVVVFVHEFGHFRVARWCGVAIDTFSIGFGKTILGWRDHKGVQWKVGALPLGGYVKFTDDADAMSTGPREAIEDPEQLAAARAKGLFHAQPLVKRAAVVAAGPLTNFVFSIFAFALLIFISGRDIARVDNVRPGTPAAQAGLATGDVITAIDGQRVKDFQDLQRIVSPSLGRTLTFEVTRNGAARVVHLTPISNPDHPQVAAIGVEHTSSFERRQRIGPLEAIADGAEQTWAMVAQTGAYIADVFRGRASANQIAGPAGIFMVSGQVASDALAVPDVSIWQRIEYLLLSLLNLAAILSVAVGIVNLLPIPILDGGHLLFYGIEGLRGGRPLPPAAQEWAYRAGFAVMASLFLFATWNDISRLLPGMR
jgi:regulator of sigma E protease